LEKPDPELGIITDPRIGGPWVRPSALIGFEFVTGEARDGFDSYFGDWVPLMVETRDFVHSMNKTEEERIRVPENAWGKAGLQLRALNEALQCGHHTCFDRRALDKTFHCEGHPTCFDYSSEGPTMSWGPFHGEGFVAVLQQRYCAYLAPGFKLDFDVVTSVVMFGETNKGVPVSSVTRTITWAGNGAPDLYLAGTELSNLALRCVLAANMQRNEGLP
jgi:hypothetical protein